MTFHTFVLLHTGHLNERLRLLFSLFYHYTRSIVDSLSRNLVIIIIIESTCSVSPGYQLTNDPSEWGGREIFVDIYFRF